MAAPLLTNLTTSVTFAALDARDFPQIIDADVDFTDLDGQFNGHTLKIAGLLAEDVVSLRHQGTAAGQIGLTAGNVTYGGTVIGTLTGGNGITLQVTFNADASTAALDALLQNLTYANTSSSPTASRQLTLTLLDVDGMAPRINNDIAFATTASGPRTLLGSFGMTDRPYFDFADVDGDGDQDAIVSFTAGGSVITMANTGSGSFTRLAGAANPFNGLTLQSIERISFADIDKDGDEDAIVGFGFSFRTLFNQGGGVFAALGDETEDPFFVPAFVSRQATRFGQANLVDLDRDGDLDVVFGTNEGTLVTFENTGFNEAYANAMEFVELTGTDNPLAGINVSSFSQPSFVDLDNDDNIDVVVGALDGTLRSYRNTGAGGFVEMTGSANPFAGVRMDAFSLPRFADIDKDGDLDLVVMSYFGDVKTYLNGAVIPTRITVNVTPDDGVPKGQVPARVTVTEDVTTALDLTGFLVHDLNNVVITVVVTASAGALFADGVTGVTVVGNSTGRLALTGTSLELTAWLNSANAVRYLAANDVSGVGAARLTVTATDGSTLGQLGQIAVDITGVNDAPQLDGLTREVTFAETAVNGGAQLLDAVVNFSDRESNFAGSVLRVTGLLAEDVVSLHSDVFGILYLVGTNVLYRGNVIGTLSGGTGTPLEVTFNRAATSAAVDEVIQNLTYANASDTPTATRDLTLSLSDAAGADMTTLARSSFAMMAALPQIPGISLAEDASFVDLDKDGDLDLVVRGFASRLGGLINNGSYGFADFSLFSSAGHLALFHLRDIPAGTFDRMTAADIDNDGDPDFVTRSSSDSVFRVWASTSAGDYVELTGTANPLRDINAAIAQNPTFVDLDSDGDLDLVLPTNGALDVWANNGSGGFSQMSAAENPFDGLNLPSMKGTGFADLDRDGDLDLVVSELNGALRTFVNQGAAGYSELTGADNPFALITSFLGASPRFHDFDSDGLQDLVVVTSAVGGIAVYHASQFSQGIAPIRVNVTAQNDRPTGHVPGNLTTAEDLATPLDLRGLALTDGDSASLTLVLRVTGGGTLLAQAGGGVSVAGSGSGVLTLTGSVADLGTYLTDGLPVSYLSVANVSGSEQIVVTVNDGSGVQTLGTVALHIGAVNDAPSLTGLDNASFAENDVNSAPQLLDADATLTDPEGNFDGGRLTLTGLLPEDVVSLRHQGNGPGEIGLSGGTVSFGGTAIGTLTGGAGGPLSVVFTAAATSAAVTALIRNLTYANTSDTPTATRDLLLTVTDAAGASLGPVPGDASFAELTGADNPFGSVDVGTYSAPALVDLDGDGDLDLVAGEFGGTLLTFRNGSTTGPGSFTRLIGSDNPFDGLDVGTLAAPTFADLDGDGDQDLIVGVNQGVLRVYRNGDASTAGAFAELTGSDNPWTGLDVGGNSRPTFADVDGDGDGDMIIGESGGTLIVWRNGETGSSGGFTALTGAANPLAGVDVGLQSAPAFVDFDGDGDLDLISGEATGLLQIWRNGTDGAPGSFALLAEADNPFAAVDMGNFSTPTLADLDGDGDLDLVVGSIDGTLRSFLNTTPHRAPLTVTVVAQNDLPTLSGLPVALSMDEDTELALDLSGLVLTDADQTDILTLTIAGSAGSLVAAAGVGVGVGGSGGRVTLTGLQVDLAQYLATAGVIGYTGAPDAFGISTLSITLRDATGTSATSVIRLDIAEVVDLRTGGTGNDTLRGDNGSDQMNGLAGNDLLLGLGGDDSLDGGQGADTLRGGVGVDTQAGGDGLDTLDYYGSAAGVVVDLTADGTGLQSASGGDAQGDVISGFETVAGSSQADTVTGNDAANIIYGREGDDQIAGGGGNDTLRGGVGADRQEGGSGTDTVDYYGSAVGVVVNLVADGTGMQAATGGDATGDTLTGFENITGSAWGDTLTGNTLNNLLLGAAGDDQIDGGGGNDTLRGGLGADTLVGSDGRDMLDYTGSAAGVQVDLLADGGGLQSASGGDATGDVLSGFESATGSAHSDTLRGDANANSLYGGAGADQLIGGAGSDYMLGGAGADIFVFDIAPGSTGFDRIADFTLGQDSLHLLAAAFAGLPPGPLSAASFHANLTGRAETADQRILYESDTGALYFDADGKGGQVGVHFAHIAAGLLLDDTSFVIL